MAVSKTIEFSDTGVREADAVRRSRSLLSDAWHRLVRNKAAVAGWS